MTPLELITGIQSRDSAAERAMFAIVWKHRNNRSIGTEDAEDLAQDTALKCWLSIQSGRVRNAESIGPFIGVVHRNTKYAWLRTRRPEPLELCHHEPIDNATPEREAIRNETLLALARAISELIQRDREVLMRWVNGETLAEIAVGMGLTLANVKTIHHRAKVQIRRALR